MEFAFVSFLPKPFGTSQVASHIVSPPKLKTKMWKEALRMTQLLKPSPKTIPQSTKVKKPKSAPHLTVEGDSLESTPFQKALLATFIGTASALGIEIASSIESTEQALVNLCAVALSYFFTDLAVGIYHHAVDNYGSPKTPIFGYQIAAFQGHHSFPWTITSRDVTNNLYRLTYPTLPQLFLLMTLQLPSVVMSFYGSFLCFIVLSQETHRQAHMIRVAPWVKFLQDTGLILSQKAHAAHHLPPPRGAFEGNYCILSGVWNSILDRTKFFRLHEALIFLVTGTEPISWSLNNQLKEEALGMLPIWIR